MPRPSSEYGPGQELPDSDLEPSEDSQAEIESAADSSTSRTGWGASRIFFRAACLATGQFFPARRQIVWQLSPQIQ